MNATLNRVLLGLLAVGLIIASGCTTQQPGVTNRAGTIRAHLGANPAAVTEAAEKVLPEMGLVIVNAESSADDGRVTARTTEDVRVRIVSTSIGHDVSQVSIKFGNVGDSAMSMEILDNIKEELGIPVYVEPEVEDVEEAAEEAAEATAEEMK
jgi:hypothetical protein